MLSFCKSLSLTKNKTFEVQLELSNNLTQDWLDISFTWTTKRDHAGIALTFSILKMIYFGVQLYDNRHWDYKAEKWLEYNFSKKC